MRHLLEILFENAGGGASFGAAGARVVARPGKRGLDPLR
jgi:hypothetical protein